MSVSVYQEITEVEPSAKSTLQFSPLGEYSPGVVVYLLVSLLVSSVITFRG